MSVFNRAKAIDDQFLRGLERLSAAAPRDPGRPVREGSRLTGAQLLDLFDSQLACRHLDLIARELRARDAGYYTIGSSGHEGNVVLGALCRDTDPAFLHYRSGALMIQRSKWAPEIDPVLDTLLSQAASADDPISGGRHKVWGSRRLWVPPQTSTIASHLPKALGTAIAIDRARRLKLDLPIPADSIVLCSFGDASINHSVSQGAFNAASWAAYQKLPIPALFVCEDNGIGISVHTPPGWVERNFSSRPGWNYFFADGLDLPHAFELAAQAIESCRATRMPTFLHLRTIRMTGHAGSDIETQYHSLEEIAAVEAHDPVLATATQIVAAGLATPEELRIKYEATRARVAETAEDVVRRPKLTSSQSVIEPLAPFSPEELHRELSRAAGVSSSKVESTKAVKHLAASINRALHETLERYPEALVFGEDVAKKGGVYNVTSGLFNKFGAARVFNTLLDETTILGMALGAAHLGFLPIPEIQYLAYLHNAEDQLRSEACSLQFFSQDQFRNGVVVRIAGLSYQKGFGGHFHNDNSVAVLRDIPSLLLAVPARGDDAVKLLRTAAALAKSQGRVVCLLEPIALYMTRDLYQDGDGLWQFDYPAPGDAIELGEGAVYNPAAKELLIVSYGNGLYMSLRAAEALRRDHGIEARVLDLRWLAPLNHEFVAQHAAEIGRVLVVDECRRDGAVGEALVSGLVERLGASVAVRLHAAANSYVPLGPAMRLMMPTEETIAREALTLVGVKNRPLR